MLFWRLYTYLIIALSFTFTAAASAYTLFCAIVLKHPRKTIDRILQFWTKYLLGLANVDYQVFNPHHVSPPKGRATILMCNHSSLYDIPLSFLAFPEHSVRMLAKKELTRIPIFGRSLLAAESPIIDRHNRQQAIKDLQRAKELLTSGIVLWIAPEGSRAHSQPKTLGPFKKGGFITAIETEAVIIPLGIRGASDILPNQTRQLTLNQRAEIHIGEPIDTKDYTLDEKDKLIDTVRASMLTLIGA